MLCSFVGLSFVGSVVHRLTFQDFPLKPYWQGADHETDTLGIGCWLGLFCEHVLHLSWRIQIQACDVPVDDECSLLH